MLQWHSTQLIQFMILKITCETYTGTKDQSAGDKEGIWTSKSEFPAVFTRLWTTLYGEGGPDN